MANHGFDVWNEAGVFVARLWQDPDFAAHRTHELPELFQAHIEDSGRPEVILDFNGVCQLNPELLGKLVMLHRLSKRLIVCNADSYVEELFRICGLKKLFRFAKDLSTALEFLKNSEGDQLGKFPNQEIP
jgi:anti-anti-sigma regulatory factor